MSGLRLAPACQNRPNWVLLAAQAPVVNTRRAPEPQFSCLRGPAACQRAKNKGRARGPFPVMTEGWPGRPAGVSGLVGSAHPLDFQLGFGAVGLHAGDGLVEAFQQLGIAPPKPVFTSQNTYSMLAMVSHNLGVCILPELVVRDISKNVVRLPLNPPMERVLGVRIPSAKKASPAASLLITQLQRTVFELEGPLL